MSISDALVTRLTFVITPTFKCDGCGAEAQGSTTTRVVSECTMDAIDVGRRVYDATSAVERNPPGNLMPTGWASHYDTKGDRHRCPECKGLEVSK